MAIAPAMLKAIATERAVERAIAATGRRPSPGSAKAASPAPAQVAAPPARPARVRSAGSAVIGAGQAVGGQLHGERLLLALAVGLLVLGFASRATGQYFNFTLAPGSPAPLGLTTAPAAHSTPGTRGTSAPTIPGVVQI